jgi:hypothetical protein
MSHGDNQHLAPAIHRVPLDKLTIFEITESELESLEHGSPESLFLNLAVAVVSTAISFSVALATTQIDSTKTFCFFVIIMIIGYLSGITFAMLWWRSHRSLQSVSKNIRGRRVPQGIQEETSDN